MDMMPFSETKENGNCYENKGNYVFTVKWIKISMRKRVYPKLFIQYNSKLESSKWTCHKYGHWLMAVQAIYCIWYKRFKQRYVLGQLTLLLDLIGKKQKTIMMENFNGRVQREIKSKIIGQHGEIARNDNLQQTVDKACTLQTTRTNDQEIK